MNKLILSIWFTFCLPFLVYSDPAIEQVISRLKANNKKIKTLQQDFILNNVMQNNTPVIIKGKMYLKGNKKRFEIVDPPDLQTVVVLLNGKRHVLKGNIKDDRVHAKNSILLNKKKKKEFEDNLKKELNKNTKRKGDVDISHNQIDIGMVDDVMSIENEFKNQVLKLIEVKANECIIEARPIANKGPHYKNITVNLRTGNISGIIYYFLNGEKFQESTYSYAHIDGIWIVKKIDIKIDVKIRNMQILSSMEFINIKVNSDISNDLFKVTE